MPSFVIRADAYLLKGTGNAPCLYDTVGMMLRVERLSCGVDFRDPFTVFDPLSPAFAFFFVYVTVGSGGLPSGS